MKSNAAARRALGMPHWASNRIKVACVPTHVGWRSGKIIRNAWLPELDSPDPLAEAAPYQRAYLRALMSPNYFPVWVPVWHFGSCQGDVLRYKK